MTIKNGEKVEDIAQDVPSEDSKQLVDKKAYEEVTKDMLKYKQAMKQQQEELKKLKDERDAFQKQELLKNQEWQKLFETTEAELQKERNEKLSEKNKFVNYHKKQAVIEKLGGFKRAEYSNFIQVDSIEVNDAGDIDQVSLQREVDRIRQNYPDLLNSGAKQVPPSTPAVAPTSEVNSVTDWNKLSDSQKKEMRLKLAMQKAKK